MFLYSPIWVYFPSHYFNTEPFNVDINQQALYFQQSSQIQKNSQQGLQIYLEEELKQHRIRRAKKNWTKEEDRMLINMIEKGRNWVQIANFFNFSTSQQCKRRYKRLILETEKWPKAVDQQIVYLRQQKDYTWLQIARLINSSQEGQPELNSKQVKQRYEFYLKDGISKQQWSLEQDLQILQQVKKQGRYWKSIAKSLPNRTELQVKNRYYGTLKYVQEKANKRWKQNKNPK